MTDDTQAAEGAAEAPASKKKFKLMKGTEGGLDYLVVAENGMAGLGIRPLVQMAGKKGIYVGMRIRSAAAIDGGGGTIAEFELDDILGAVSPEDWASAFPGIAFKKNSKVRASNMMGTVIPRMPWQAGELPDLLKAARFFTKMVTWVTSRVPSAQLTVSSEDMRKWIRAKIEDLIDQMIKAYPSMKDEVGKDLALDYVDKLLAKQAEGDGETPAEAMMGGGDSVIGAAAEKLAQDLISGVDFASSLGDEGEED